MCISWGGMSQGLRTASSRALRWGCSGGAVGFQEQQEATVVGALWEQDVESSVAFQDFGFILVVKRSSTIRVSFQDRSLSPHTGHPRTPCPLFPFVCRKTLAKNKFNQLESAEANEKQSNKTK